MWFSRCGSCGRTIDLVLGKGSRAAKNMVLARYRPIDDRARYWAIFFLDEVREVEVRKFSEGKKKMDIVEIRTLPTPLTDQCN